MAHNYPQRGGFPPRPQPPTQPVTVTITGKILYPKGPWGSNRPVRHRASIIVWEGTLYDPLRPQRHLKKPTGKSEEVQLAHGDVVQLYDKVGVAWERFTEGDGSFRITTKPIDPHTYNLVLGIRDYNFVSMKGEDIRECFYDLRGSLQLIYPQGSIPPTSQGVGTIRVPWPPPKFMTYLAVVNATLFLDTQKLARRFSEIAADPSFPTTIKLYRESELSQQNVKGEDYTHTQKMFEKLVDGKLQPGFPDRLALALSKVPRLAVKANGPAATLSAMLDRLVTVNIEELEKRTLLTPLLNAISNSLGDSYNYSDPTDDPAQDMSAACAMMTVAALMARGAGKVNVKYGFQDLSNDQKWLTVDISVSK